jgi:uncharacterized protein YqgV (UPF0045/DUF77 family)
MAIAAQVSVYPLRQPSIGQSIERALEELAEHRVELRKNSMSTIVSGDQDEVFAALRAAFRAASEEGDTVMVVTLSNACPAGPNT